MKRERNETIATKGFNSLILDFVFDELKEFNLPAYVSGRVLNDGWYAGRWSAENIETAIDAFMAGTLDYN